MEKGHARSYMPYAILFTIIALVAFVSLLFILSDSQADDVAQSAGVGNAVPTVDSINVAIGSLGVDQATINPIENGARRVYVHGALTDNNGCQDADTLNNYTIKIRQSDQAIGCGADNNNCYQVTTSNPSLTVTNCTGAGDLNLTYEGYVDVQFYADPTDAGSPLAATNWIASVQVNDEAAGASNTVTDTFEMASLLAFDVTANVNYGTVALGADSPQQVFTFTSTGNRALDADQTANGNMTCNGQGSQDIPVANVHLSLTNGFTYGTGDQALGNGPLNFNLNLGQRTNDGVPLVKDAYLILRMPVNGVSGTCTNTVTFTAKADA